MNDFAMLLEPSSSWEPAIKTGTHGIDVGSNRVRDLATGRWVGALVPSDRLSERLADLPLDPSQAKDWLTKAKDLHGVAKAIEATELIATVGALASVANLGVSVAGFAAVLRRLSRIEGKLDHVLSDVQHVRAVVGRMHMEHGALSLARMHAAYESLERAVAADSAHERQRLAERARNLFQESRLYYLHLWRALDPWMDPEIPIPSCVQMQGRYVACANGEIDAQFLLEDGGALRSAAMSISGAMQAYMAIDPIKTFRSRSDAACMQEPSAAIRFQTDIDATLKLITLAVDVTRVNVTRLSSRAADADLPAEVGVPAIGIARAAKAARDANGIDLYLVKVSAPPAR